MQPDPLPPKEIVRKAIWLLLDSTEENPILKNADAATMNILLRKLPKEIFETHAMDDAAFFESLKQYGVRFKQPIIIIAKTVQALFGISRDNFMNDEYRQIIDILIEGVLLQVDDSK
jgi:hypothetical protein